MHDSNQVEASDLEQYLVHVRDPALKHTLEYGVGFLHETMSPAEKEAVDLLFGSGAIQVWF